MADSGSRTGEHALPPSRPGLGRIAAGVDEKRVAGVEQVPGHGRAHDAQADKADLLR